MEKQALITAKQQVLLMSTEIPILYNELRKEFNKAMANADGDDFVERPKALSVLGKRRTEFIQNARLQNQKALDSLRSGAEQLQKSYSISSLEAKNLIVSAQIAKERLASNGALFGEIPYNFSLTRMEISEKEKVEIEAMSVNIMRALEVIAQENFGWTETKIPLNNVEREFENIGMIPNAGRIDIVLTEEGPRIIEVNSQWVDAIGALGAFQRVNGLDSSAGKLFNEFAKVFTLNCNLAIINPKQTTGSREIGATLELEKLAKELLKTGRVKYVEILDPIKTNLEYLARFDSFYVNCDPKFFTNSSPDWILKIAEKAKSSPDSFFPAWRPSLDKKLLLAALARPTERLVDFLSEKGIDVGFLNNSIVPTIPLSSLSEGVDFEQKPMVIKGDGYSLNAVALSKDPLFDSFLNYAKKESDYYVVQPYLEGKRIDAWVYDTGSEKVKFIKDGYTKLNVWVIKGKVVGMLLTISDNPLISDKGYNSIPIIRKNK